MSCIDNLKRIAAEAYGVTTEHPCVTGINLELMDLQWLMTHAKGLDDQYNVLTGYLELTNCDDLATELGLVDDDNELESGKRGDIGTYLVAGNQTKLLCIKDNLPVIVPR